MLPERVFANSALTETAIQDVIEGQLDDDESLEEILTFLQKSKSSAPVSIKKAFKDYTMEAGLLFYQGRICVPDNEGIKSHLLELFHNSPIAGHPGHQRTFELLSRHYYWPGMRSFVQRYVESCERCQRGRRPKVSPIPLQTLEVPTGLWEHISYDMIMGLPMDGTHDSILVIVDSFSKFAIFVPCSSTITAEGVARLFLEHCWKDHRLPQKTVSDWGLIFNNKFIWALYKLLGITPHFSSTFHPQSDGQTEQVNPSIEYFLRTFSGNDQSDWSRWLPLAQFSYNNAVHSATGVSPFMCLYGRSPAISPSKFQSENEAASTLTERIAAVQEEVASMLCLAKERMNTGRPGKMKESYTEGEKVWLDGQNIWLRMKSAKLSDRRLGPFHVKKKLSNFAYQLELPGTMKIHDVFHVSLLSKVREDMIRPFSKPPAPETIDGEEEYEVEDIVDSERHATGWFYHVKWKGYGPENNTWEPKENLANAPGILRKYHSKLLKKARDAAKSL